MRNWRIGLALSAIVACREAGPGKNIDFDVLRLADRVEVRTAADRPVITLTGRQPIELAVSFIQDHRAGWREPWYGPNIPSLMLYFYKGDRKLGGFGLTRETLVIDPTMGVGWVSRKIDSDEADRFLKQLGLTWPT